MCDEIESSALTLMPADTPRGRASFFGLSEQSATFSAVTSPPLTPNPDNGNDGQARE